MTAAKTVDEYAKLDANDESLARWKASLGIGASGGTAIDTTGPKACTNLTLHTKPVVLTRRHSGLGFDS